MFKFQQVLIKFILVPARSLKGPPLLEYIVWMEPRGFRSLGSSGDPKWPLWCLLLAWALSCLNPGHTGGSKMAALCVPEVPETLRYQAKIFPPDFTIVHTSMPRGFRLGRGEGEGLLPHLKRFNSPGSLCTWKRAKGSILRIGWMFSNNDFQIINIQS